MRFGVHPRADTARDHAHAEDEIGIQPGGSNQRIFDFGNDTDQYLFLTPDIGGTMRFGLRNNNGTTNSISTAALPTGSWQHVAVTMQGSNAKIYLNGNLQTQGTVAGSALSGTSRNYIGKSQWSTDPLFDGDFYASFYPDVAASRRNPLEHYVSVGLTELRQPNTLLAPAWIASQPSYLEHGDGRAPFEWYLAEGEAHGASPSPEFCAQSYLARYPDAASCPWGALAHYLHWGRAEGRDRPRVRLGAEAATT